MIRRAEKDGGIAGVELSRHSLVVQGTAIVLPAMRAGNDDGRAVLPRRPRHGRHAAEHDDRPIGVAHVVVDLIAVQALLLRAGIHLEAHGAGDLRPRHGHVPLLADPVLEFRREHARGHVVEEPVQRQVDARRRDAQQADRAPRRRREKAGLVARVRLKVRLEVLSDPLSLVARDQVRHDHRAVALEECLERGARRARVAGVDADERRWW